MRRCVNIYSVFVVCILALVLVAWAQQTTWQGYITNSKVQVKELEFKDVHRLLMWCNASITLPLQESVRLRLEGVFGKPSPFYRFQTKLMRAVERQGFQLPPKKLLTTVYAPLYVTMHEGHDPLAVMTVWDGKRLLMELKGLAIDVAKSGTDLLIYVSRLPPKGEAMNEGFQDER